MQNNDFKPTKLQRYMLVNQLRILEALYPDEASALAVQREVLERGYEMLYSWGLDHIYDGEDVMTEGESREVWDTLDMFDALDRAIDAHKDVDFTAHGYTRFRGYDGNSETKFMSFAAFTMERMKRFDYLPMEKKGYWNSHFPMRPIYKRMLSKWQSIPEVDRFNLSVEQVNEILREQVHPDDR